MTLDDVGAWPIGGEPIVHRGRPVGQVTSAAFGHTLGRPVAMGYVRADGGEIFTAAMPDEYGIDIAGRVRPTRLSTQALYDPSGTRLRS